MKKAQPKSNSQIRRLFGLAKPNAHTACMEVHDYLADLANHVTGERTASLADLTFDEANAMIKALNGDPFPKYGQSRRTENYRKQKAGIKSVETENHLNFILELAQLRGMSLDGVTKLAGRMNLPWPPRTTEQGNKIVEALKAMNKRDGLSTTLQKPARSKGVSVNPQPTFRRIA